MIFKRSNFIPDHIIDAFRNFQSATVYEGNGRKGALDSSIKPISTSMKCCGRALTVKLKVGDNLTLLKAMDMSKPGDVIVCDSGGIDELAHWGDLMSSQALQNGTEGIVINGGIRDAQELERLGFPVFARNVCIKGAGKEAFGSINEPICIGNITIQPGDLIVGDRDGVTVVPFEEIENALKGSIARHNKEADITKRIQSGERLFEILKFYENLPIELREKGDSK